jgi:hypothetical protein
MTQQWWGPEGGVGRCDHMNADGSLEAKGKKRGLSLAIRDPGWEGGLTQILESGCPSSFFLYWC